MILVVGATGHLGMEVCRSVVKRDAAVRALVRPTSNQDNLNQLRDLGIELAYGDLQDRASLDAACNGVNAIISSASSISGRVGSYIATVDRQGQLNLIDAAQGAGVDQFVFVTLSGNMTTDSPLNRAKRTIEAALQNSNLAYTNLRSSFFMEYFLSPLIGFDYPNRRATIFGEGENKITWITIGDVAQAAASAVNNPSARSQVIEIGGPEMLSPNEAVRIFEDVIGAPFEVQYIPKAALESQMNGTDDAHTQSVTALSIDFANGDVVDTQNMTARLSAPRTTVKQYVEGLRGG